MAEQQPIPPGLQAGLDQELALLDELLAMTRRHRQEQCTVLAGPCVGDEVFERLRVLSRGEFIALAFCALARLADHHTQPPSTTVEGISP